MLPACTRRRILASNTSTKWETVLSAEQGVAQTVHTFLSQKEVIAGLARVTKYLLRTYKASYPITAHRGVAAGLAGWRCIAQLNTNAADLHILPSLDRVRKMNWRLDLASPWRDGVHQQMFIRDVAGAASTFPQLTHLTLTISPRTLGQLGHALSQLAKWDAIYWRIAVPNLRQLTLCSPGVTVEIAQEGVISALVWLVLGWPNPSLCNRFRSRLVPPGQLTHLDLDLPLAHDASTTACLTALAPTLQSLRCYLWIPLAVRFQNAMVVPTPCLSAVREWPELHTLAVRWASRDSIRTDTPLAIHAPMLRAFVLTNCASFRSDELFVNFSLETRVALRKVTLTGCGGASVVDLGELATLEHLVVTAACQHLRIKSLPEGLRELQVSLSGDESFKRVDAYDSAPVALPRLRRLTAASPRCFSALYAPALREVVLNNANFTWLPPRPSQDFLTWAESDDAHLVTCIVNHETLDAYAAVATCVRLVDHGSQNQSEKLVANLARCRRLRELEVSEGNLTSVIDALRDWTRGTRGRVTFRVLGRKSLH